MGVSTIVLMIGIGFFVIPPIGIAVWEMNRYQFIQRQLEKLCDAASLAGATRMIEADTSGAGSPTIAQTWRHKQGIEAAKDFIEGTGDQQSGNSSSQPPFPNTIVSVPITASDTTQVAAGSSLSFSTTANQLVFKAFPSDPNNGYAEVPVGSELGTSISVSAYFTEQPTLGRYLGLGAVPVYASSTSATPRLDIMVALDCSGSMDDGSYATFVVRMLDITSSAASQIGQISWPATPDYTAQCGPDTPPGCGCASPSPPGAYTCFNAAYAPGPPAGCAWAAYNSAMTQYNAAMANYTDLEKKGMLLEYNIVGEGELFNLLQDPNYSPYKMQGFQVNLMQQQHLALLQPGSNGYITHPTPAALTYLGSGVPGSGASGLQCSNQITGFTDVVANLGDFSNPQPDYGNFPYSSFSFADANQANTTFSFPNIPTLVEAAAGRLEQPQSGSTPSGYKSYVLGFAPSGTDAGGTPYANYFWTNTINQPLLGGNAPPEHAGMQQAYIDAALQVYQPQATVADAAKQFLLALQGSGKNIRVGIVAFDEQNAGMAPSYTGGTPTTSNGISELAITPTSPDTQTVVIPSTDLLPIADPSTGNAGLSALLTELGKIRPGRATDIFSALDVCRNTLLRDRNTRASRQAIILITDGISSVGYSPPEMSSYTIPDPVTAINNNWGANDIPVYCVGLSATNTPIVDAMEDALTDGIPPHPTSQPGIAQAAGNGSIYYQTSENQLRLALLNIARRLVRLAA